MHLSVGVIGDADIHHPLAKVILLAIAGRDQLQRPPDCIDCAPAQPKLARAGQQHCVEAQQVERVPGDMQQPPQLNAHMPGQRPIRQDEAGSFHQPPGQLTMIMKDCMAKARWRQSKAYPNMAPAAAANRLRSVGLYGTLLTALTAGAPANGMPCASDRLPESQTST